MRRTLAVRALILSMLVHVVAGTESVVHAADAPRWLADARLVDVSGDGKVAILGGSVVMTDSGASTPLPESLRTGIGGVRLSGDGRKVLFISSDKLVAEDTDSRPDAYAWDRVDGVFVRLTASYPAQFYPTNIIDESFDGLTALTVSEMDRSNRVHFVSSPNATRLVTSVLHARVFGMSDDGRYVIVHEGPSPLRWMDLLSGETRSIPVTGSSGFTLRVTERAQISADGNTVVFIPYLHVGGQVYRWRRSTGQLDLLSVEASSARPASPLGDDVSVSGDGSVVTWLETPVGPHYSTGGRPSRLMRWTAPGPAVPVDVSSLSLTPDGVLSGGVTDDGRTILFEAQDANGSTSSVYEVSVGPVVATGGAFTPMTPTRLVDTRVGLGARQQRLSAGSFITVDLAGHGPIPADAMAVAVQVAVTAPSGAGFVSVLPAHGQVQEFLPQTIRTEGFEDPEYWASINDPTSSAALNIERAGEVVSNMAIVRIGTLGMIEIFSTVSTHLVVDLLGWWNPTPTASAGRFEATSPTRILDSRPASLLNHDGTRPPAGSVTAVQVTGRGGVPTTGLSAVAVNVAVTQTAGSGYVQTAPANALVVGASATLHVRRADDTVSATTIVPVDASGRIAIYTQTAAHLIVDVVGWFTDSSAAASSRGLFVPVDPTYRHFDSRWGNGTKPVAGSRREVVARGSALVGNLAITDTNGPGYVQLGPARTMTNAATASISVTRVGETRSNAFLIPVDEAGLAIYTYAGTHIVLDVTGFFTP